MPLMTRNNALLVRTNNQLGFGTTKQLTTDQDCCVCDQGFCCNLRHDWPDVLYYTTNGTGGAHIEITYEMHRVLFIPLNFVYAFGGPFLFTIYTLISAGAQCYLGTYFGATSVSNGGYSLVTPLIGFKVYSCKPFFASFEYFEQDGTRVYGHVYEQ